MGTRNRSGIGYRLRAARQRRGWSREELAVHAGLSWSAIAQVESGRRRNLRPDTLASLAAALGVSIDYLVNGGRTPGMLIHQALLYDSDESFAEGVGRFLLDGSERSEPGLAVTSKQNLALLRDRLGSETDGVELLDSKDHYRTPEAMVDLFMDFLNTSLERGAAWVRIVGEPVWTGRSAAERRLWARYESLVNLMFGDSPVSALCPYDLRNLDSTIVADAHATHPQLVERDRIADSPGYRGPGALALEPE